MTLRHVVRNPIFSEKVKSMFPIKCSLPVLRNPSGLDYFSFGTVAGAHALNLIAHARTEDATYSISHFEDRLEYLANSGFSDFKDQINNRYYESIELMKSFVKNGFFTEEYITALFNMCYCEDVVRKWPRFFDDRVFEALRSVLVRHPSSTDIDMLKGLDLGRLVENCKKAEKIVYGQSFGGFSELISGADCDLIADGSVVEIKTVKTFDVHAALAQALGYVITSTMPEPRDMEFADNYNITNGKVRLYSSRHHALYQVDIAKYIKKDRLRELVSSFVKACDETHLNGGFGCNLISIEMEHGIDPYIDLAVERLSGMIY